MRAPAPAGPRIRERVGGEGVRSFGIEPEEEREQMKVHHQEEHAPHFENQYTQARETGSTSQMECGRRPTWGRDVDFYEDEEDGELYPVGLRKCGSVWCCPTCARRVCAQKGEILEEAVEAWRDHGGHVEFVSLTLRHHQGQRLDLLLDCVQSAWTYVRGGSEWREITEEHGVVHYVQTTEVTVGENGWHPHKHLLLFSDQPWSEEQRDRVEELIWTRWRARLVRMQDRYDDDGNIQWVQHSRDPSRSETVLEEPDRERAVVIEEGGQGAGHYVAKMGLGREVSRMDAKVAQGDNRTPWQVLYDATFGEDPRDDRLWREYIEAMHGRAHWHRSQGMKDDPRLETSQREIDLGQPDSEEAERQFTIGATVWEALRKDRGARHLLREVLEAYRDGGFRLLAEVVEIMVDQLPEKLADGLYMEIDRTARDIYSRTGRPAMKAAAEGV